MSPSANLQAAEFAQNNLWDPAAKQLRRSYRQGKTSEVASSANARPAPQFDIPLLLQMIVKANIARDAVAMTMMPQSTYDMP